jgi:hypothetical protein
VFAVLEFQLQRFDRATNHAALQLHNASIKGGPAVHGGEETECSFAPFAVSMAEPFSRTVNSERTDPCGK